MWNCLWCFGFKKLAQAVKREGALRRLSTAPCIGYCLKFRLGLFDNPYVDPDRAEKIVGCKEHRDIAYRAATESMVLLKNDNNFLPLDKNKGEQLLSLVPMPIDASWEDTRQHLVIPSHLCRPSRRNMATK